MSKIEVGQFSNLLRRSLGMKGQEMVASELSPEVSAVIELESASDQQWDFLKNVKQCSVAELIVANVGAGGHMRLRNPPNSGVIATVQSFKMSSVTTGCEWAITLLAATANLLNASITVARDPRFEQSATLSQAVLFASFTAASGAVSVGAGTIFRHTLTPIELWEVQIPVILLPGRAVDFGSRTANVQVSLSAEWKERHIPALEL